VNQPALSRMVKQFEEHLQLTLLERQARGVKLTQHGTTIFLKAQEIFSKVDELKRMTSHLGKVCQGELRMGATDSVATALLAAPIKKITEHWPLVYPIVQIGTVSETLPLIANGKLEFGCFFHIPTLPTSLAVTKRWPIQFHLVCLMTAIKNKLVLDRFIGSREVDDNLNTKFPTLEKWKRKQARAKILASSNSLLLHHELVRQGLGISVLPAFLIEKELASGKLIDLMPTENLIFDLKLVQRKDIGLSLEANTFINCLKL
jgi:DNA-binding transcriptional LysR family regulator